MKGTLLVCVLMVSLPSLAAEKPNPADYTLTVHVKSSELEQFGLSSAEQRLSAELNGKHLRLGCNAMSADVHVIGGLHYGLLAPGDYKAKPIQHKDFKPDYLNWDEYQLLLPDNRTMDCRVTGLYE